jgi:Putative adhesin
VLRSLELTRGRRWALALGLPFVLAIIGYGSLNYVAYAGQDSYRIQPSLVPAGPSVTVSVGDGDASIAPSSDGQAHLAGVVHYSLFRPSVSWKTTSSGTSLTGFHCFWVGSCGASLTLIVPPDRPVKVSSSSGNITARSLRGTLTLNDDSGDIRMVAISGESVVLSDDSGNVSGENLTSPALKAHDDSGDVSLSFTQPPDLVTVSDDSGNIKVVVPAGLAYRVQAGTDSGSTHVEVPTDPSSPHVLNLHTDSGDVSVVAVP